MKWKDILSGMKVANNIYPGKEILNSAALSGDKCGLRDLFSTVEMTETKTRREILLTENRDRLPELVFDQTFN